MNTDPLKTLAETGNVECPQCRYSLEGLPGPHACPECGRPYGRNVLTWRPKFTGWWIGFVFGTPGVAIMSYGMWKSGERILNSVLLTFLVLIWGYFFVKMLRSRARDHLSIDGRGISFCSGGGACNQFDWTAVRYVNYEMRRGVIHFELRDRRNFVWVCILSPKDTAALVEVANNYAKAANEDHTNNTSNVPN